MLCYSPENIEGKRKSGPVGVEVNEAACARVLFFHPAEESIVIVIDAPTATRMGVAEVVVVSKAIIVHVDVLARMVVVEVGGA